ncbi:IS4/Tn5 family transposase DNA-binding protein [Pollutimonas bauzanensis]|uniref:IS4/Tn5 family transposase DNA-binding protein n=1 Tax=Pollutimonas bauzanensis TaxID=658167 RepID=UPI0009336E4F
MHTLIPSVSHLSDTVNDRTWITHELADSQFGDKRLDKRLKQVISSLWGSDPASLPRTPSYAAFNMASSVTGA